MDIVNAFYDSEKKQGVEKLAIIDVPAPMRGVPIALICAGMLALAFMGFAGITIG